MAQPQVFPLYPGGTLEPDSIATIENGLRVIRNVTQPSLTAYLPDAAIATGTAVIVAPGGAYHFLAHEHEGTQVAAWLNARDRGIPAQIPPCPNRRRLRAGDRKESLKP